MLLTPLKSIADNAKGCFSILIIYKNKIFTGELPCNYAKYYQLRLN